MGFRFATREIARRLNITGWVCNEHDGSVRATVYGSAAQSRELVRELREHFGDQISEINERELSTTTAPSSFEIHR